MTPQKFKPNNGFERDSNFQFVNRRLTKEESVHFDGWKKQEDDQQLELIGEFVGMGNKTSVSWDDKNTCYIASSTCVDPKSLNKNFCLTSRSDDWFEAILMNIYKTTVLAEDGMWSSLQERQGWG